MSDVTTPGPHDGAIVRLDGGVLGCARLLMLIRDRTAELPRETVLHVVTENPIAPIDLPAWCRITGHQWRGRVEGTSRPTFTIGVAPEPTATQEAYPWKRV